MKNRLVEYLPKPVRPHPGGQKPPFQMQDLEEWTKPAEEMIRKNPGIALGAAFLIGATLAWWIKRT